MKKKKPEESYNVTITADYDNPKTAYMVRAEFGGTAQMYKTEEGELILAFNKAIEMLEEEKKYQMRLSGEKTAEYAINWSEHIKSYPLKDKAGLYSYLLGKKNPTDIDLDLITALASDGDIQDHLAIGLSDLRKRFNLTTEKVKKHNLTKRKGKYFLNDFIKSKNPELLKIIFSNFYPINSDCSCTINRDGVMFYGYSPHFRELTDEEEVPEYVLTIKNETEFDSFEEVQKRSFSLEDVNFEKLDVLYVMLHRGEIDMLTFTKLYKLIK